VVEVVGRGDLRRCLLDWVVGSSSASQDDNACVPAGASVRLGEAGRRDGGLAAVQEAVETYRALAEASPAACLPYLATSLNNLSVRLGEAGETARATAATVEADGITTRQALAADPCVVAPTT
jgi:hypothetical protein